MSVEGEYVAVTARLQIQNSAGGGSYCLTHVSNLSRCPVISLYLEKDDVSSIFEIGTVTNPVDDNGWYNLHGMSFCFISVELWSMWCFLLNKPPAFEFLNRLLSHRNAST